MVERFTIARYRCETCMKVFQTLNDAMEHENVCREHRDLSRSLIGMWVCSDDVVGIAMQTRVADSNIGICTPFIPTAVWRSPNKVHPIDGSIAEAMLFEELGKRILNMESKADGIRRDRHD